MERKWYKRVLAWVISGGTLYIAMMASVAVLPAVALMAKPEIVGVVIAALAAIGLVFLVKLLAGKIAQLCESMYPSSIGLRYLFPAAFFVLSGFLGIAQGLTGETVQDAAVIMLNGYMIAAAIVYGYYGRRAIKR